MALTTLTRFPPLISDIAKARDDEISRHALSLQGSDDDLYRAWASVLSRYTGHDDTVSFMSDQGAVTVLLADGTITTESWSKKEQTNIPYNATAIYFEPKKGRGELALELHIDRNEGEYSLRSNSNVPSEHLPQIATLLRCALQDGSRSYTSKSWTSGVSQFSVLNKKPCKLEGPEMLHDLVLGFALEDRSAIEYYDARQASISLSYRDLGHRVSQLEGSIRGHLPKTKPGKRKVVPILIPQSPELYIAMLATLRTGCAFCPIQLDAPKERIEFIISDIDASLLLTISSVASRIEGIADLKILSVDAIAEKDPSETDAEIGEQSTISADGTAYVMYTSGSTGLPKGVPVSHRAATQSLLAHDRHIPKFSRFLQFAAPTFDVSIFEIFFTLYRRSTLIVCERSRLLNDLPGTMREMCVDAAELTPTVAGGLLRQRQNVPELKLLLTIGEMLTPQVVEEFGGDETKESLLWGMYGPTEAAIHCTVQPEFSAAYRPGNIGIPFDTVSAFIVPQSKPEAVDGHISEILPVGFVGELAVGGHQLADGYLNRDEQTSQVFVKTADYGMLYRTGDKARMLLDGTIECLGRISSGQVKLRGQRVELGEVRHAAAKTQGCMDAVVSVVDDNLIVFCLVEPHVKADDILTSCRNWLPTFMVPSDVVLLDDLPRLSSGKVDVKALSQNYKDNKALRASTTPDVLTPAEETFNTVLQSVFSLSIPIDAPLDMVGMDSLTAIKAASHLRHAGFDISMIDLLSSKTSRQLAQRQQPHENGQAQLHPAFQDIRQLAKQKLSPDEFDAVEEVFPCSPVQLAMLAETEKDPSAYCNWIEFEVNRALDRDQLVEHLQTLASKHRMLRSGFRQLNSTSHPYACITHKDLESDRISEVGAFKYHFSLEGSQLLHPVRVQTMSVQGTIRVLLQIHHSLYDGWSVDVLLRDWQQVLDGTQLQESPSFSQISNYHLRVDRTSALDYWQDHLSEFSRTSFPNFNGKRITSPSIEHESLALDADLGKLTRVSSELQISRAAVFQAALAQILGSYLSTEDVLIGTVASGRSLPLSGIEEIFGPCLATSPLRLNIDPSAKVIDLLRQVQELNKMIQQHAIVPAQMIKRICDFPPDTPLWDVLFVWQESLESRNTADYDVRILATEDRLECALTLEFEPRGDQIVGKATYHNDLLSREQVQLLFRQVDALVTGFLMNVNADIAGQDDWFSTETLSLSNPSPDLLRFDQGLEYTVEVHAAKNPHSLALVIATDIEQEHATIDSLTYKQLNDRTNQLAHFLRGKDLKSAELIAICMEKTADLYVAILAVLKLGLGYLPITPATPLKRIKTILDEAGVSLCLTHRDMFHSLALESVCEVLNVDTVNTALLPTTNLETPYNGSRAAYAVFTSGSTGIPKGVLVTQQNLKSNLAVLAELYPTTEKDRLLQSCSQAFDVSVFEIFFTWQQGMCLCTGSNDVLFRDLEMAVRSMNVTHLSLTPTVAALVDPNNTPKVKFLVTAGEGVTEKVKNLWSDRGLFQGYGPSETTNICTVKPRFSKGDAIRNIGPPFRNTSAFVFDPKADRLLPKGAVGELCFGGDQIYRGYINQPELTASKFIEHPTFGRLYRSGDSGRILPDGSIMFAARLDDQVKIRGQRVELHEISHCILTRADIVDCLTLAVETSADRKIAGLVSFIVPAELGHVQVELRDRLLVPMEQLPASFMTGMFTFLNESLPSYMVPTALIPIRAVPMTVQGKIDKRRLLAELDQLNEEDLIALSTHQQEQESGVMLSPIERVILAALEKTLNKSSLVIARGTSFFSFGLDSISAIAFSRHLSRTLDTKVAVSSVLRHSSVARLAHFLDAAHPHNEPSHIDANALPQDLIAHARNAATQAGVDIAKVLPCTPLQEAMLSSSSADSASYLNTTDLAICCDLARLKEAWVEMFRRHDTLRTTFAQTNNTLYPFLQLIIRETDIPWIDLTTNAAVAHSFPSAVGSFKAPVQITVFQQDDREYLRFVCHHALYDASALQILVKEIEAIYCQELLPPAPDATPFWQEIMEHRKDTHLNFWVDHLADFTPVILQTNGSTQEQITRISSLSLGALEDLSHKASQSLLAACQIAWARTLWALHDNPDVCFGNVVSGRVSLPEHLDNLVAPTFNTIPFRMNLGQHSNCASAMRAAQRINAASITHQYSPLRMIVSRVGHAEGGIFSSILLLQSSHLELDTNIWSIEHEHGVMDFPLILELIPNKLEDTFEANLYYNTSVLYVFEAEEILLHFLGGLHGMLETPRSRTLDDSRLSKQLLNRIATKAVRPASSKKLSRSRTATGKLSAGEAAVCSALAELLGIPSNDISPETTIHHLGLDSIGAIQLATKLRAQGFASVTAPIVMKHPGIADLAQTLSSTKDERAVQREVSFDLEGFSKKLLTDSHKRGSPGEDDIAHIWPCTPVQAGLLSRFLQDGIYVNHITYAFNGGIAFDEIHQAFKHLELEFLMLRTGFITHDDFNHPYLMMSYHAGALPLPVTCASSGKLDVNDWRQWNMEKFRRDIARPPWAACVEEQDDRTLMHVSIFHGIYDATSLEIITRRLISYLKGDKRQQAISIGPVLSVILGQALSHEDEHHHAAFWTRTLESSTFNTFPDLTPLHVTGDHASSVESTLNVDMRSLEQRCHLLGWSIHAVGQLAWAQVLSAYLGEDNVCFGLVLSGRDITTEAINIAFPTLVTVPFSMDLVGKTNRELIEGAMAFNSSVHDHQFNRLSDIQRWTKKDALFDTLFAYQKFTSSEDDTTISIVDELSNDEFCISLELEPAPNGQLLIRATFKTNIIPIGQAELLVRQYAEAFQCILDHPEDHATGLHIAPQELLSHMAPDYPLLDSPVQLLHEFVELQASRQPEKTAFEFFQRDRYGNLVSRTWTYRELDAEGNCVARYLRNRGVKERSYIGICFNKCPEASFAILGILKAGCAYVAIDPTAPPARKNFIAKDSGMVIILSHDQSAGHFENVESPVPILYMDEIDRKLLWPTPATTPVALYPNDICYCLYTSGTTGTPKGCEITHENAVQAMRAFSILFSGRWNDDSKWLQFASFHFDVSVLEQYWSWSEGIVVVSAPRDLIFEDLELTIRSMGITHIDLTPSLASLVHPENVPDLCKGVFITGGEQLKQEILDVWGEHEVIHNGYGPTETTIGVTMYTQVPRSGKPANIGKQFANVGTYVLHPGTNHRVLRGGVGELCISGCLVGKGYLNRADLTADKFPFVQAFGERIYRTGDLVRLCHDDTFLFLGRIDDQVKLRGQRLEIGEINSTIRRAVAAISDVATYVLRHPKQQNDQLVTFFVADALASAKDVNIVVPSHHISHVVAEARAACLERLPGYMVPTFIIPVTRMPLSTNNKTDAKVLKQLFDETSPEQLQNQTAVDKDSLDDAEERIAEILSAFSGVPLASINPRSSIFELGLDSVSVLGFCNKLRLAGYGELSVKHVMSHPILRDLARLSRATRTSASDESDVATSRAKIASFHRSYYRIAADLFQRESEDVESVASCTPLQEGMISRSLNGSRDRAYFSQFAFDLVSSVDIDRLQRAWQRVCNGLQILRTWFMQTHDGYAQVVFCTLELPFSVASVASGTTLQESLDERHTRWVSSNDLHYTRPIEVVIWHDAGRSVMALNIFHGLYDGNCLNRLLDQVSKSYLGEEHLDLGPKFHSILPYGPLTEADGAEHFWTSRISESPAMPLTVSGLESEIAIELNLASKFDACRRALNVTHQAILQAAWVATLMEQSSDGVVSTGIVVSGRAINVDGADKVIGPMFNTIPFCTNSTMVTTWKSLVKLCHDFIVQSLPFQHTPLRAIQKWIRSDPKVGLFDSLFLFQIADKKGDAAFNNQLWTSQPQKNTPDYPLTLDVEYERDGPLRLLLISRGSKLNGVKLDKLMERLETALMQILNDADSRTPLAETNSIASAGDSGPKPHFEANGHGFNGFIWTAPAIAIRKEISRLSQVEENEITEHLSIFELGLDSIDAIKLSSRLTAKGFRLPVSTIMRTATIGSMLHALNAEEDDSPTPGQSLKRLQHVLERYFEKNQDVSLHHAERILPTTPLQDAMIRGMIESDYWQYFNHDVLRLRKDVDEINLRTAWQTVFESTPILRTSFHTVDDPSIRSAYAQVVSQDCAFPWHSTRINDIGSVPKVIEGLRNSARNASSKDTLFQLTMVYDDCGDRYLILSMPHALYDGYSLDLLHQFVREAYEVRDFQKQPSWDATLGKIIEAQESHATIQFWSRHLSKATTCLVKANNDQGHEQLERPAVHRQELAAAMSVSEIRAFCKKQGITPQTLGQCAFAMALATYVHRLDPVFGVVLSGRDTEEAQRLIFPTMNTIAFRCKIDGTKSHFLRATQEIMAGVRAHQHFPLHRAQRLAASTNQMLFNTLFIFQSRANSSDQSEALYKSVDSSSDVDLPICVEMGLEAETVILRTACHGDLFDKEETGELLRRVQLAIQHLTDESTEAIIARSGREVLIGNLPAFVVEESSPRKNGYDNGNAMEVEELPTTPDTEIVLEVVAQVAQVAKDEISPSTTLYHLGLDSISAIKVCSRLKKRGILISVSNLLRAENVEAIAKAVVHSKPSDSNGTLGEIHESAFEEISEVVHSAQEHRAVVGIPDDLVEASLPTTAGQIYMLKHWVQSRGSLFFDTFYFIVAPSSTSIQHLQRAVTKWIENGSMLRTTFTQTSNKDMPFVQHIIKAENVEVVHESIPFGAKPNSGHVRSGRFMTKTKMRSGPQNEFENLFAVSVTYETSKTQSWKLGVRIHHALYDGVSLPALLSDLESLILASSSSSSSSSSSKQKGTRAFSDYTTDSFVSAHDRSARSFWTAYLTALQPTSTGHELNQRGAHSKRLSQYRPQFIGSAEGILQLTKKCGVTLPALFLAVVAQVLAAIKSNASDGQGRSTTIVIGVYIANRGHTSEYLAMYPAVNLLPVVVDTSLPLLKSAAKVQKDLVEISDPAHVSVSLSQILDWTDVKVDTFVNWLQLPDHDDRANYQTDRFRIQGAIDQVIENTAESFTLPKSFTSDHLAAAYPPAIDIEVALRSGSLDLGIFGSCELLTRDGVEDMFRSIRNSLCSVANID